MPIHTKLESWQLEQPPDTPVWICAVVGAGAANRLPGVERDEAAAIEPDGTAPRWQVSQVVDDGMCDVAPTGDVAGMTMIFETPANELPVIVGQTQAAKGITLGVLSRRSVDAPPGYAVEGRRALAALESASPEAAAWWRENAPDVLAPGYQLIFPAEVCERLDDLGS